MKAQERHHLKQNEFAQTTARFADAASANKNRIALPLGGVVVVVAVVAGVMTWRGRGADAAGAGLGIAMATAQSQVVPAPTVPGATQQAGTFPTQQARADAVIKAFNDVAQAHP